MVASTNLADLSNFMVGSDTLKITPFFIRAFNIPGISFSHPSMSTRSGVKLKLGADSMEFGDLDLEVLLDSDFNTYFELLDLVFKEVDWDYDSYSMQQFDLWVVSRDSSGRELFRFDFFNCRINSIGNLSLEPEADLGAMVSLSVSYDYYRWTKFERKEICISGEPKEVECKKEVDRYYKDAPRFEDFRLHNK